MTLPEPLTPPDCDLQDFEFMPVMVRRLLKSETWSLGSGDERAAAIALWFESWHQVPAASLPNNDRLLRKLADSDKWPKVRAQALRGWVLCSDDRLYHPVAAEKALEAWVEKLLNSISGSAGNAKRWNVAIDTSADVERLREAVRMLRALTPKSKTLTKKSLLTIIAPQSPPDDSDRSAYGSPPDSPRDSSRDRKGQGQGQGQGQGFISVPNGTGASAPPAAESVKAKSPAEREKAELWAALKTALVEQDTCPDRKAAGVLLGKAASKYGQDVFLEAARATVTAKPKPINMHTYLIELCEVAAGKRVSLNQQEALEKSNRAVLARFLEKDHATQ